jgi:LCP family protein required for cell wall assembly
VTEPYDQEGDAAPRPEETAPPPVPEEPVPAELVPAEEPAPPPAEEPAPPPAEEPATAAAPAGPPPPRRPRSPTRRVVRVLCWIAVLTSVSVLVASAVGFGALALINSHVNRQCIFCGASGDTQRERPAKPQGEDGKALNFLIVGSDSRDGASEQELKEFSTEAEPGKRTDTIILVHLSPQRDKAVLVSFPRDTWVEIPGHGHNRINAAFVKGELERKGGGPALLIQTVERLTDVYIDHYVEIDFRGFLKMVNALGGVDVCLPHAVDDPDSGLRLPAGRSHVNGKQALSFVRARKFDPTQDFGRIRRQQQFLGSMVRRATSLGILARPDRLYRFLDTTARSLTVDDDLSFNDMRDLATKLRTLDPAKIVFVTAPTQQRNVRIDGKSVVLPDEAGYAALFGSIRNDDAIKAGATPAPTQPPSDLIVKPSRIRLKVLNGSGVNGAAKRAADDLAELGFQIRGTGDADATSYTQTIVRHGPSKADSARTVAAALPGSAIQLDQTLGSTIEVVVGAQYDGVRPVTVSTPTTAPPPVATPTGTPSPVKTITAADEPEGC